MPLPLPPFKDAQSALLKATIGTSDYAAASKLTGASANNAAVFQSGASSLVGTGPGKQFSVLKYPIQNLGMEEYPHYVMFFITERKSSLPGLEKQQTASVNFDPSQNNTGVDKSKTASGLYTTLAGGLGGITAGGAIGRELGALTGKGTSNPLEWLGKLTGGAAGVAAAAEALTNDRTQVLLKQAVALYLPHRPTASYQAEWSTEDVGIIGGLSQQIRSVVDTEGAIEKMKGILAAGGGAFMSAALSQASKSSGVLGNVGAAAQVSAGIVPNPFKAQLFKSMGFRQWTFDYSFLPKNPDEHDEVQKIIFTFKKFMHPVLGTEKFIMDYPAEFTLGFYHKDSPNDNLFKISNCALTGMTLDYGGTDFTTFRNRPGAPTEINMKLNFIELEIMTRERIEAGY